MKFIVKVNIQQRITRTLYWTKPFNFVLQNYVSLTQYIMPNVMNTLVKVAAYADGQVQ